MNTSALALEFRRKMARNYIAEGHTQAETAKYFHVSRTSVKRWADAKSLDATKATGRKQIVPRQKILALLEAGPLEMKRWTGTRLSRAIDQKFGVRYHPDHCIRILSEWRSHRVPASQDSSAARTEVFI